MESKEELYHNGLNPFHYDTFSDEECVHVLFALEALRLPYTRMPHLENNVQSLRFYVKDNEALQLLRSSLEGGHIGDEQAESKYALVYENSFV